jgi:hypothetical protein
VTGRPLIVHWTDTRQRAWKAKASRQNQKSHEVFCRDLANGIAWLLSLSTAPKTPHHLQRKSTHVFTVRVIITETRDCFFSADDGGVLGARADGNRDIQIVVRQRRCITLCKSTYKVDSCSEGSLLGSQVPTTRPSCVQQSYFPEAQFNPLCVVFQYCIGLLTGQGLVTCREFPPQRHVRTCPVTRPVFRPVCTGFFPRGVKRPGSETDHPTHGALPVLPPTGLVSWCGAILLYATVRPSSDT